MYPHKKHKLKSKRLLSLKYIRSPWSREWAIKDYKRRLYEEWERHYFGTMPKEVYEVWMRGMAQFVSTEYYVLKAKAVEMWPAWFPWEVKHKAIPQEVHDAYNEVVRRKLFQVFDEPVSVTGSGVSHGGIMQPIADAPVHVYNIKPFTMADFNEMAESFNREQDRRFAQIQAEQEQEKANKALWDKYYKPFKLPYRP